MKKWDVFISHASEDKDAVVLPLCYALKKAGLKVWLDRQELRLGDSLREKIDEGLAESRFGVLILSPHFLNKQWPKRELNGLMALEEDGHKVILPVWHEITKAHLSNYSPILADRLAASTSDGIAKTARAILDVVLAPGSDSPSVLSPTPARLLSDLLDRNAATREIVEFLAAHPAIIERSTPMTPLPGDIVFADVNFQGVLVPFVVVRGAFARTYRSATLVAFTNISGSVIDEQGQLAGDVVSQGSSLRLAFNSLKSSPLSPIKPEWETSYAENGEKSYADLWREAFSGSIISTRGDLRTRREIDAPDDRNRIIMVDAVLFARKREKRTNAEASYLDKMAEDDISVRSYDRLLEQAMEVEAFLIRK